MRRGDAIREALIDNTIHLIAQGGFESATTRNITKYPSPYQVGKLNDAHIYRVFGSKEGLYAEVYATLDAELTFAICNRIASIDTATMSAKEIMTYLWEGIWPFMLHNEDRCRCYVRYYYSIYFREGSQRKHRETFERVANTLRPMFKEEADVTAILHSIFSAIMDFAIRVYNHDLKDTPENAAHIFNVLYCMMSSYLKQP